MHNPEDRAFFGHPRGLGYIAFTEAWERFSYYGMQSLLILYMVDQLLHPGHIEHIAGFTPFRHFLETLYRGPLAVQPLASAIFGLYTGLVYLTPIAGGFLADRLLGRTRTITIGALLMAAGQFLVAYDVTFLIALTLLLIGVGCFKGNLASQVGGLYATGDNRRADAFQIYYIFINAGVIISPLIAGTLGEKVGWQYGFGAAGVGMLIGLAIYLSGRKWLPSDSAVAVAGVGSSAVASAKEDDPGRVEREKRVAKPPLTHREKMAIIALLLLLPVLTIAIIGNQQIFNAYLVWAERNANLIFFGEKMPTTWLVTLDSIVSVSFLALTVIFWRLWAKKFPEPPEITKIGIGSLVAVTGFISLATGAAIAASSGTKVSIGWLITFHVLNSIGFANIFPVSLALYARVAPAALSATIIGIYYLAFFAANNLVGTIGGLLEKMPATHFWLLHSALCGVAGVIFLLA
ncbi:MAG: peptide MFS transporter, partial [Candidatus Udaeobacter sp.]